MRSPDLRREPHDGELLIVGHSNSITKLAFSTDGNTLVSASYDKTIIVWDVPSGKMRQVLPNILT